MAIRGRPWYFIVLHGHSVLGAVKNFGEELDNQFNQVLHDLFVGICF